MLQLPSSAAAATTAKKQQKQVPSNDQSIERNSSFKLNLHTAVDYPDDTDQQLRQKNSRDNNNNRAEDLSHVDDGFRRLVDFYGGGGTRSGTSLTATDDR